MSQLRVVAPTNHTLINQSAAGWQDGNAAKAPQWLAGGTAGSTFKDPSWLRQGESRQDLVTNKTNGLGTDMLYAPRWAEKLDSDKANKLTYMAGSMLGTGLDQGGPLDAASMGNAMAFNKANGRAYEQYNFDQRNLKTTTQYPRTHGEAPAHLTVDSLEGQTLYDKALSQATQVFNKLVWEDANDWREEQDTFAVLNPTNPKDTEQLMELQALQDRRQMPSGALGVDSSNYKTSAEQQGIDDRFAAYKHSLTETILAAPQPEPGHTNINTKLDGQTYAPNSIERDQAPQVKQPLANTDAPAAMKIQDASHVGEEGNEGKVLNQQGQGEDHRRGLYGPADGSLDARPQEAARFMSNGVKGYYGKMIEWMPGSGS